MRVLICHDDSQLRRVEKAIATIEANVPPQQRDRLSLLAALKAERTELLRYAPHRGTPRRQAKQAA
jgi:hypothetical protein